MSSSQITAEALHQIVLLMTEYRAEEFKKENGRELSCIELKVIGENIKEEIRSMFGAN